MNERNNKLELLGSAPIPKALMALGIPIMIGMLINALYNLVDAYFVSGLGKSQMGAISVAPNITKIGLRKIAESRMIIAQIRILLYNAVLATLSAVSLSPRPNSLDR